MAESHSTRKRTPLLVRFWANVQKSDGCWIWTGSRNRHQYGRMSEGSRPYLKFHLAHRLSWQIHRGEIPAGLYVCHRCDNPPCVNPEHLFLGTQFDNMGDASRKGRLPQQRYAGFCAGERNGRSKLTDEQAREIRDNRHGLSQRRLAVAYGVSRNLVRLIRAGKNWTHV